MRSKKWLILLMLVVTACGPAVVANSIDVEEESAELVAPQAEGAAPTTAEPTVTVEEPTATPFDDASDTELEPLPPEPAPSGADQQFTTDFTKHTVPYSEVLSGGPPKDGIPALDDPKFVTVAEADAWLQSQEPIILFEVGDEARAYPLQILTWHEIVNDVVGGVPVTVTFCPLCNTGIAFERTFEGQVLDFGTTGRLRFSNLVMYNRQTETWWQQASGDGIAGQYAGRRLTFLPAPVIGWDAFKPAHPDGKVLSRDTGFNRSYGRNPYEGYDDVRSSPFLYDGPRTPGQLPPMARVLTVEVGGEAVAYPNDVLREAHVVNDTIAETKVVVLWEPGTASALDSGQIAEGRDVGAGAVFLREIDGGTLDFSFDGEKIIDEQTGSEWNVLGQAVRGPLLGSELTPAVSVNHFWFSWAAFMPETRIFEP